MCSYSQLRYDGFEGIASNLSKVVNIISACPPMARLHQVVNLGLQAEAEGMTYYKFSLTVLLEDKQIIKNVLNALAQRSQCVGTFFLTDLPTFNMFGLCYSFCQ